MHEGRMKTERSSVYVGSRLKLADDIGKASPESQPFSRTGENPRYGMLGGSRKRRHHSKPGPRLDPTRLRGRREILVPTATSKLTRDIFTLQTELVQPCVRPVSVVLVCASKSNLPLKVSNASVLAMLYVELAVVATLILINGLLAMAELAIASSRRARLRTLVEQDVVGSRRALALASNPGRFLSTVQGSASL